MRVCLIRAKVLAIDVAGESRGHFLWEADVQCNIVRMR